MDFYGTLGLEAEIVYNGLLLNQRLVDAGTGPRYKINDIGGLDDADVRDAREANPMRDGELALPAYYGGRTITITGRILARNVAELRQMQTNLKTAFASLQESQLKFYNASGSTNYIFINARKSAPLQMREAQNNAQPHRDFLITLRASDPRFYSSATNTASTSGAGFATAFSSYNNGTAFSDPVIRINGPLMPTVVGTTGQFLVSNLDYGLALGFSMSAGALASTTSYVEINCSTRAVSGSLDYSNVAPNSVFPQVVPATNTFVVSGLTGTGSVQVYYKSAWM